MGPLAQDPVEAKWVGKQREMSGFLGRGEGGCRAGASRRGLAIPLLHAGLARLQGANAPGGPAKGCFHSVKLACP